MVEEVTLLCDQRHAPARSAARPPGLRPNESQSPLGGAGRRGGAGLGRAVAFLRRGDAVMPGAQGARLVRNCAVEREFFC